MPSGDHPRIRGEHVPNAIFSPKDRGSSPHTRGARPPRQRTGPAPGIIPAYAGSTERLAGGVGEPEGSSPHTRGARQGALVHPFLLGIIPAYAGSTRSCPAPPERCRDHPRIRGEHYWVMSRRAAPMGSSPHTRGARRRPETDVAFHRIIPAYAGSTFATRRPRMSMPDHPRIRGEHPVLVPSSTQSVGSSPHTRGALVLDETYSLSLRIIPAYAGSTHIQTWKGWSGKDHPRIRGEH